MSKVFDVAVVGATGIVGETMLSILAARDFPIGKLYPLASARSAGKKVRFKGELLQLGIVDEFDFSKVQIGLFSAGATVSKAYAPRAIEAGVVVIDNTSQYRYDNDIPLIIPEVNSARIADYKNRNIIANPNCSTIQMLVAIKPIYDRVGLKRINVCTYQAVSGTGKKAIEELQTQTQALMNEELITCQVYPKQIAFNVLPHIDSFQENGYSKEEMKMVWETQKILEDDTIKVNPTAVRVPVFHGHSEALHIETRDKISATAVRTLLEDAVGVRVIDEPAKDSYPTAASDGEGSDWVHVGRIREDISHPHGINMWVVSDNVRKGAALNSIQIAEFLVKHYL